MKQHQTPGWRVGTQLLTAGVQPLLMGILNVTPDSFSDGGHHNTVEAAVTHGVQLAADGASIIDVGGESTRPGAAPVSVDQEMARTIPVIERLVIETDVPISIDTSKAAVAAAAIKAGALIVNDISGLTFDSQMLAVVSKCDVAVCIMHIKGTPQSMQKAPRYDDVVREVIEFLQERMKACLEAGVSRDRICLDPGIGFGKTAEHNLELMRAIPQMHEELNRPLLIGHSRKRFLSSVLGRDVEERLAGTIGVSLGLADNGADILRIHDVAATRDAITACQAVRARGQQ